MQKTKILKHLLERFTVKRKDRLFVNKRGDAGEKEESLEAVSREKKVHAEHPFKLFNLISPQQTDARKGQRIPRGGRQVVKDKGWMLDAVQEAYNYRQEVIGEPGGNSRKMLMERLAATQRMMPIPRIG